MENNAQMKIERDVDRAGFIIHVYIPSKQIALKQGLPNILHEPEAFKYVENELVNSFTAKIEELTKNNEPKITFNHDREGVSV